MRPGISYLLICDYRVSFAIASFGCWVFSQGREGGRVKEEGGEGGVGIGDEVGGGVGGGGVKIGLITFRWTRKQSVNN